MKPMNLMTTTATVALTLLTATGAFALDSKTTQEFVKNASIGSQFEIESSKLALEKSQDPEIKQFAQQMIQDHTDAADKLKATAQESGVDSSNINTDLDSKHQQMMEELKTAKGDDFDKAYINDQKKAHNEAVNLFKKYSRSGDDKPLQDFATQTLPTLEKHQDHVKDLKS